MGAPAAFRCLPCSSLGAAAPPWPCARVPRSVGSVGSAAIAVPCGRIVLPAALTHPSRSHWCRFAVDFPLQQKRDVEGTLFLVQRNQPPWFQLVIPNRMAQENVTIDISPRLQLQVQPPYLVYRCAHAHASTAAAHRARCLLPPGPQGVRRFCWPARDLRWRGDGSVARCPLSPHCLDANTGGRCCAGVMTARRVVCGSTSRASRSNSSTSSNNSKGTSAQQHRTHPPHHTPHRRQTQGHRCWP